MGKGSNWVQDIPKKVYTSAVGEKTKHEYETQEVRDLWEFFSMADLCEIILYGTNWSTLFEKVFTLPSEAKKAGGKSAKTTWMRTIDKLQKNAGRSNFNISKQDREMLLEVKQIISMMQT